MADFLFRMTGWVRVQRRFDSGVIGESWEGFIFLGGFISTEYMHAYIYAYVYAHVYDCIFSCVCMYILG